MEEEVLVVKEEEEKKTKSQRTKEGRRGHDSAVVANLSRRQGKPGKATAY